MVRGEVRGLHAHAWGVRTSVRTWKQETGNRKQETLGKHPHAGEQSKKVSQVQRLANLLTAREVLSYPLPTNTIAQSTPGVLEPLVCRDRCTPRELLSNIQPWQVSPFTHLWQVDIVNQPPSWQAA